MAKRPKKDNKGSLLEDVAAWLHEEPGVKVETRVRIPGVRGGRKREIDVLLTVAPAGYSLRLAIECKNRTGLVGAPDIDAFVGKLSYLGIPPQLGIFIATHGYTGGAIERARADGVRLLHLDGLSEDGMRAEVFRAIKAVVYIVGYIVGVSVTNDLADAVETGRLLLFENSDGKAVGSVFHEVWKMWRDGLTPDSVGRHSVRIQVPEGWVMREGGREIRTFDIEADLVVRGHVLTIEGTAGQFVLTDAESHSARKVGVTFNFPLVPGIHPLKTFESEPALAAHLADASPMSIAHRVKAPRLAVWNAFYWPPTDASLEKVNAMYAQGIEPDLDSVEGVDLRAAFMPTSSSPSTG